MPGVFVTGGDFHDAIGAVVEGQVEVGSAVAAHGVGAGIARSISRTSVLCTVPGVFVTGGDFLDASGAVVEG